MTDNLKKVRPVMRKKFQIKKHPRQPPVLPPMPLVIPSEVYEEFKKKVVEKSWELKYKVGDAVMQLVHKFDIYFENLKEFLLDYIKNKCNELVQNSLFKLIPLVIFWTFCTFIIGLLIGHFLDVLNGIIIVVFFLAMLDNYLNSLFAEFNIHDY